MRTTSLKVGATVIPSLQAKVGSLVTQSHSATKEQNGTVNPGAPNSTFFFMISKPLVEIVGKGCMQTTGLAGRDCTYLHPLPCGRQIVRTLWDAGTPDPLLSFSLYCHHTSSTTYFVVSVKFLGISKLQFSHV